MRWRLLRGGPKRDGVAYRLPTEEEWEYAARNGAQGDLYPWGPEWQDDAAIVKDATPFPVGSRPNGKNKWGVVDLIGNVWELTSSKVSVYPGNRREVPKSYQDWITIRGAGYVSDPANAEAPVTSCLRDLSPFHEEDAVRVPAGAQPVKQIWSYKSYKSYRTY